MRRLLRASRRDEQAMGWEKEQGAERNRVARSGGIEYSDVRKVRRCGRMHLCGKSSRKGALG